jgi:hypothetical protein
MHTTVLISAFQKEMWGEEENHTFGVTYAFDRHNLNMAKGHTESLHQPLASVSLPSHRNILDT